MSKPKLFVGSSQTNHNVAQLIAEKLGECADTVTWKDGVFGPNKGFLETLLEKREEFDFAVFVLAADDMTTSKEETKPAPRDNVLFESGLFMGALGRDRVFLVYDEAAQVKIPSDLLGITLASYDGSRIGDSPEAAVAPACRRIKERITASRFAYLLGDWESRYPVTVRESSPTVDETVAVRPYSDGLSIESTLNSEGDYYSAKGRMVCDNQMIGRWESRSDLSNSEGRFILTVSGDSKVMYGYCTAPDMEGRTVYATWVLAKKDGADDVEIKRRLRWGQELLRRVTVGPPAESPASPSDSAR